MDHDIALMILRFRLCSSIYASECLLLQIFCVFLSVDNISKRWPTRSLLSFSDPEWVYLRTCRGSDTQCEPLPHNALWPAISFLCNKVHWPLSELKRYTAVSKMTLFPGGDNSRPWSRSHLVRCFRRWHRGCGRQWSWQLASGLGPARRALAALGRPHQPAARRRDRRGRWRHPRRQLTSGRALRYRYRGAHETLSRYTTSILAKRNCGRLWITRKWPTLESNLWIDESFCNWYRRNQIF